MTKNYFRKADGVLVIFDLTDKNSFESRFELIAEVCSFWIEEVKERAAEDSTQIIIGNKVDMKNVTLNKKLGKSSWLGRC